MAEGSRMNVYILLDTSGSITKEAFDKSREATIALITKVCEKQKKSLLLNIIKSNYYIICLSSYLSGSSFSF